ncbi:MAG TPA: helix-turn-helix domain-containing protein [Polyangiaceae bacterium]|nr:helix-turn-helix domain-containing protein [Polyangiaceae bacterium]
MSPGCSTPRIDARAAPLFAALGDERRLRLLSRLSREGPLSIGRLSEDTDVTRQAITKHLVALARAGLVQDTRAGRERIYQLSPGRVDEARRYLEGISAQWDASLARLRRFVEDAP